MATRDYKEELELVRHSNDLRLEGVLMLQAYHAGELRRLGKMFGNVLGKRQAQRMGKCEGERECYNEVEQQDEHRHSIVQYILRRHRFPLEDSIWWVLSGQVKKQCK